MHSYLSCITIPMRCEGILKYPVCVSIYHRPCLTLRANYLGNERNRGVTKNKRMVGEESLQLVTERAVLAASPRCYQSCVGYFSRARRITKNFFKDLQISFIILHLDQNSQLCQLHFRQTTFYFPECPLLDDPHWNGIKTFLQQYIYIICSSEAIIFLNLFLESATSIHTHALTFRDRFMKC